MFNEMFSSIIQKIKGLFNPKQSTVGSVVPNKKKVAVQLGYHVPPTLPCKPSVTPGPPPARTMPRRVDNTVRQSVVGGYSSSSRDSNNSSIDPLTIDPLTAAAMGYIIGSSDLLAKNYIYMGDGTVEEVTLPAQPVVCEPTPTFDSSPSHSSSYDSHSSHSSSSSDSYSSSSYDSGSYDSGSSSSFD